MKLIFNKLFSEVPVKKELERLNINELIRICKLRRSIKHPFKKNLIEYIIKTGWGKY